MSHGRFHKIIRFADLVDEAHLKTSLCTEPIGAQQCPKCLLATYELRKGIAAAHFGNNAKARKRALQSSGPRHEDEVGEADNGGPETHANAIHRTEKGLGKASEALGESLKTVLASPKRPGGASVISRMSWPAEKLSPDPVSTTTAIEGFCSLQ